MPIVRTGQPDGRGRPWREHRAVLNGILRILRTIARRNSAKILQVTPLVESTSCGNRPVRRANPSTTYGDRRWPLLSIPVRTVAALRSPMATSIHRDDSHMQSIWYAWSQGKYDGSNGRKIETVVCPPLRPGDPDVATLLLARTTVRQRQLAIRRACRASPGRLVRQALTRGSRLRWRTARSESELPFRASELPQTMRVSLPRRDLTAGVTCPGSAKSPSTR
jgi:hypothetical protein